MSSREHELVVVKVTYLYRACIASVISLYFRAHFYKVPDSTGSFVPLNTIA